MAWLVQWPEDQAKLGTAFRAKIQFIIIYELYEVTRRWKQLGFGEKSGRVSPWHQAGRQARPPPLRRRANTRRPNTKHNSKWVPATSVWSAKVVNQPYSRASVSSDSRTVRRVQNDVKLTRSFRDIFAISHRRTHCRHVSCTRENGNRSWSPVITYSSTCVHQRARMYLKRTESCMTHIYIELYSISTESYIL